ncbi:acetamidase/formamidase family protein [Actinomadura rupiterrae]|uniref:acetamidase/formamidase family protein n=1 Tax=Actinomadura rupiterrae TaxID=559627 RepID=UPI0020A4E165|nr:acetamidase/formamidase family protein [Actinomadura rupiterrae]MCP2339786.1 formamidase [Actinomadura rupiterrae]
MPSSLIDLPRRWHPQIPAAAEVITGGTARLAVPAAGRSGPLVVVGAEPGDVVVVDVLSVTRDDGAPTPRPGHPGSIGCASPDPRDDRPPGAGLCAELRDDLHRAGLRGAGLSEDGLRDAAGCSIAPLTAGSRVLLPVRVLGARLAVDGLHFPARGVCHSASGVVEVRVNLTRRGVERFAVTGPILMPDPSPIWR